MLIWIKMIQEIPGHPEGEIRQWDERKAQNLIDKGFAVKVENKVVVETATDEPVGETAVVTQVRGRGRPPKTSEIVMIDPGKEYPVSETKDKK